MVFNLLDGFVKFRMAFQKIYKRFIFMYEFIIRRIRILRPLFGMTAKNLKKPSQLTNKMPQEFILEKNSGGLSNLTK